MNFSLTDPAQLRALSQSGSALPIRPTEVQRALAAKQDIVIVDVRDKADYDAGHVPGAINLPRERWSTAEGLDRSKVNVVYCYSHTCPLGGAACAELTGKGYPVVEMDGGFEIWETSDFEIER
jgi:rhodanese-related sulfurtransferase